MIRMISKIKTQCDWCSDSIDCYSWWNNESRISVCESCFNDEGIIGFSKRHIEILKDVLRDRIRIRGDQCTIEEQDLLGHIKKIKGV